MILNLKFSKEYILQELKHFKEEFKKLYGVTKLGIFGSVARNEMHNESDIDIVVEMKEANLFFMVHIKEILEEKFKMSVDIIRYRASMNKYLKARIEREAIYV